jgi:hypothetical protein
MRRGGLVQRGGSSVEVSRLRQGRRQWSEYGGGRVWGWMFRSSHVG